MSFFIKTVDSSGTLLNTFGSRDFLLVHLVDGRLVASFNLGGGVASTQTQARLNDGNWHFVDIRLVKNVLVLYVDQLQVSSTSGVSTFSGLNVFTGPLLGKNFIGALAQVKFGDQSIVQAAYIKSSLYRVV